jgi:hypothetical protein
LTFFLLLHYFPGLDYRQRHDVKSDAGTRLVSFSKQT